MDTNDESAHALFRLFCRVLPCVDVHVLGRWRALTSMFNKMVTGDVYVVGGWRALMSMF